MHSDHPLSPVSSPKFNRKRVAVIGAGPCGLATCRWLKESRWDFTCYDLQPDLGGVWLFDGPRGRVHASTHLISSKRMTEFSDYPMPRAFPHYPDHRQALEYLRGYAEHHGLLPYIQLSTSVDCISEKSGGYDLRSSSFGTQRFDAVVLANGHHAEPRLPDWTADLRLPYYHSSEVKDAKHFAGQRVLVVGGGNSGCDLAVDISHFASHVCLSLRRGYHILPKYLFGAPLDRCGDTLDQWPLPSSLKRRITRWLIRVAVGDPQRYGLPPPDHDIFQSHPIVNSLLPIYVGHHRIAVKPDVADVAGSTIHFRDGSQQEYDCVILATGYRFGCSLLEHELSKSLDLDTENISEISPNTDRRDHFQSWFLNGFHREKDNFFVIGRFQPTGGIWRLAELQARLMSSFLRSQVIAPKVADWFRTVKRHVNVVPRNQCTSYLESPRHRIEVDFFSFRRELRKWNAEMDRRITPADRCPPA